jgi:hypothetical protein
MSIGSGLAVCGIITKATLLVALCGIGWLLGRVVVLAWIEGSTTAAAVTALMIVLLLDLGGRYAVEIYRAIRVLTDRP